MCWAGMDNISEVLFHFVKDLVGVLKIVQLPVVGGRVGDTNVSDEKFSSRLGLDILFRCVDS